MKIKTDITTLSRVYPLFEEAGIEGILTGDYGKIKDLSFSGLCGALLKSGKIAEICGIITDSEVNEDRENKPWSECSLKDCMEVIVPFLYDIIIAPSESEKVPTAEKPVSKKKTRL